MQDLVRQAGDGTTLQMMGSRVTIRVRAEDTGGAFSVVEIAVPPGFQAPPVLHRHREVDWYGFVEEGEVAMELDGSEQRIRTGGIVVVPRGVAFRWWNPSSERGLRWHCTYTPGGFEHFFEDMLKRLAQFGGSVTPAAIASVAQSLWAEHGVETIERL
ncbi:MAG: cupin domain-containing protein [Acidobacteria bacterium]|nr:cupin domain-containing protein [Acidobacteriota bacterium]MBV9479121.1 cupin domain-containing protein [Acidobacteriota bacterium]